MLQHQPGATLRRQRQAGRAIGHHQGLAEHLLPARSFAESLKYREKRIKEHCLTPRKWQPEQEEPDEPLPQQMVSTHRRPEQQRGRCESRESCAELQGCQLLQSPVLAQVDQGEGRYCLHPGPTSCTAFSSSINTMVGIYCQQNT